MAICATAMSVPIQTGEIAGRHNRHHHVAHRGPLAGLLHRGAHSPFRHGSRRHQIHPAPQPPILEEPQASSTSLAADTSTRPHHPGGFQPGSQNRFHTRHGPRDQYHRRGHAPGQRFLTMSRSLSPPSASHGPFGHHGRSPYRSARGLISGSDYPALTRGRHFLHGTHSHGVVRGHHHPVRAHGHHFLAAHHGIARGPQHPGFAHGRTFLQGHHGHGAFGGHNHPALMRGRHFLDDPHGHGVVKGQHHPGLANKRPFLDGHHGHGAVGRHNHPVLAHGHHHFLAGHHGIGPLQRPPPSHLAPSIAHVEYSLERLRLHSGRSRSLSPVARALFRHPRASSVPPLLPHPGRHGSGLPRHRHHLKAPAGHLRQALSPTHFHTGPFHQHLATRRSAGEGSIHDHAPGHPQANDSFGTPVPDAEGTCTVAPSLFHGRRRRSMPARATSHDAPPEPEMETLAASPSHEPEDPERSN